MPAGFQSYNDSAVVQIDETYQTPLLLSAPTVALTTARGGAYQGRWGTLTVAASDPLVFLGNTQGNSVILVSREQTSPGNWEFNYCTSGSGHNQKMYVFDRGVPQSSTFGLQVWGPTGALIYDSNAPFLRISSVFQCSTGNTSSFSVPQDGRTYAALLTFSRSCLRLGPSSPFQYMILNYESMSVSSTTVSTNTSGGFYMFPHEPGPQYEPTTAYAPQVLLADVTYM